MAIPDARGESRVFTWISSGFSSAQMCEAAQRKAAWSDKPLEVLWILGRQCTAGAVPGAQRCCGVHETRPDAALAIRDLSKSKDRACGSVTEQYQGEAVMSRVCMVVFSEYPKDPRVRREAEALVEAGIPVDVICLRGKGVPQEVVEGALQARPRPQYAQHSHINSTVTPPVGCEGFTRSARSDARSVYGEIFGKGWIESPSPLASGRTAEYSVGRFCAHTKHCVP